MKFILLQKKIPLECGKPLEFVSKIKFFCFQNYFCLAAYSTVSYIIWKIFQICKADFSFRFYPKTAKKYLVLQLANTKHQKGALENEVC